MSERSESTSAQYGPRLFRAVGLVAVGAAMHVLLPDRSMMLLPGIAQQQLVYVESQPVQRPLVVERTTVFAPLVTQLDDGRVPVQHAIVPASILGVQTDLATAMTGMIGSTPERDGEGPTVVATSGHEPLPGVDSLNGPDEPSPAPPIGVPLTNAAYTPEIGVTPLPSTPVMLRAADSAVRRTERPEPAKTQQPSATEEQLVRRLLDEYAGALERLDVQAAKSVYPNVDGKALKRAFEQVSAQRLTLQACGITISGSTANARCQGSAAYHPKVGSRSVQIASGEWTFDLSKTDTDWRIVNTLVR